jgi:hypothetical protein
MILGECGAMSQYYRRDGAIVSRWPWLASDLGRTVKLYYLNHDELILGLSVSLLGLVLSSVVERVGLCSPILWGIEQ